MLHADIIYLKNICLTLSVYFDFENNRASLGKKKKIKLL